MAEAVARTHRRVEDELRALAGRIDGFFGDDSRLELDRPGSFVRWRNELRLDDRGRAALRTSLRASLELPSLTRRLARASLVVAGESTPDRSGRPSEDAATPAYAPSVRTEQAAVELRLDLHRQERTLVQIGAGVRPHFDSPYLEPVVRLRFHQRHEPGLGIGVRLVQELSWTGREKGGEKTRLDVERAFGPHADLRWSSSGGISEASRGYEVASELALFQEHPSISTGTTLGLSVFAHSNPVAEVDLYRLWLRLRRPLWVGWLFAEMEPALEWPFDTAGSRIRLHTITFRLEIQFDGRPPIPAGGGAPAGAGFR